MFPVLPVAMENVRPLERVIVHVDHVIVLRSVDENVIVHVFSRSEISVEELLGMEAMGVLVIEPPVIVISENAAAPAFAPA